MAKFKAKVTFAAGEKMYYPFDEQAHEAPDELVKAWAKVGFVEEIIEQPATEMAANIHVDAKELAKEVTKEITKEVEKQKKKRAVR
jgi:hypothetical protein